MGCCRFQDDECWFQHNEVQNFDKQHPEIIEKLFDLMEKMTTRIEAIENQNQ